MHDDAGSGKAEFVNENIGDAGDSERSTSNTSGVPVLNLKLAVLIKQTLSIG